MTSSQRTLKNSCQNSQMQQPRGRGLTVVRGSRSWTSLCQWSLIYLNDEADHSSIQHSMFYHSKTLLYYRLKSAVLYFGSVTYSQQAIIKSVKKFCQARSHRQCFSEESNLHRVSPWRTTCKQSSLAKKLNQLL